MGAGRLRPRQRDLPGQPDDGRLCGDPAPAEAPGTPLRDPARQPQPPGQGSPILGRALLHQDRMVSERLMAAIPGRRRAPAGLPGDNREDTNIQHAVLRVHSDGRGTKSPRLTSPGGQPSPNCGTTPDRPATSPTVVPLRISPAGSPAAGARPSDR